jgi:hypothetical protein
MLHEITFILLAIEPSIWVAIITAIQAIILTFGVKFFRTLNKSTEVASVERQELVRQMTPSNGKTVAQVVELVNDKIDLLGDQVHLMNDKADTMDKKVDYHHKVVMQRMDKHEDDDERRFDRLENKIVEESGSIQDSML